ncbi:hypothetical protein DDE82_000281 [Stemphylium lycopersici]|uniref:Uncharacterized protein n=1 Tax=Stemphylium lycopersici TaxID=183478 RepID=A0A364MXP2_STELY|nr:hypothetical protein TW65_08710 [Stemphylium lycopersici]RAR06421.1 hypothetical protein DDE83_006970 [Stemphylium lycopersici]RAR11943.1 hypothetical protein DDE82_000281 [Stemphylium lycopersici]
MPHSSENLAHGLSIDAPMLINSQPYSPAASNTSSPHLGPFELEAHASPHSPHTASAFQPQNGEVQKQNSNLEYRVHGLEKDQESTHNQLAVLMSHILMLSRTINKPDSPPHNPQHTIPPSTPTTTTAAAAAPAPAPPPPPFLSHKAYLLMLTDSNLSYISPYAQGLDPSANYAAAGTKDPNKKRCKVGRPKGKILRRDQMDDLARQLCDFHKEEVGFLHQVLNHGRDPLLCLPVNWRDEEAEG